MGHEIITHISIENNKLVENKVSDYEVDKSTDERQETITIEGVEETITTAKYVSSLGYCLRYEKESLSVSQDEGMDIYSTENNSDMYYTVEGYSTSYDSAISSLKAEGVTLENITINGNSAATYSKEVLDILQTHYYIKANNGVFIITVYHPNTSEYIGGWGSRIGQMIKTFEIRELGQQELYYWDFPQGAVSTVDEIVGEWEYSSIQKDGKDVKFKDVFGDKIETNAGSMIFNTDGAFTYCLPGASSEEKISGNYLYSDADKSIYLTYNKREELVCYRFDGKIEQKYGEYVLTLTKKPNNVAQDNKKEEIPKDNTSSGKDTTQAPTKIPQTGITNYIVIGMSVVIVYSIVSFIKYGKYREL